MCIRLKIILTMVNDGCGKIREWGKLKVVLLSEKRSPGERKHKTSMLRSWYV